MEAKNLRDNGKYSGVILHCSHLEPLEPKSMHPLVRIRDKNGRNEKNYNKAPEIEEELKTVDLGIYLDFNDNRDYIFDRCEGCDGPLLGHIKVKCCGKQGSRYGTEAVKSFEYFLKRIPGFKEQLEYRRKKRDEIRVGQIAEAVKTTVETVEKKGR